MTESREFDVIVFGATGFVGELTARHLAEHAPDGARIAIAGRSATKLARVRSRLGDRAAGIRDAIWHRDGGQHRNVRSPGS